MALGLWTHWTFHSRTIYPWILSVGLLEVENIGEETLHISRLEGIYTESTVRCKQ